MILERIMQWHITSMASPLEKYGRGYRIGNGPEVENSLRSQFKHCREEADEVFQSSEKSSWDFIILLHAEYYALILALSGCKSEAAVMNSLKRVFNAVDIATEYLIGIRESIGSSLLSTTLLAILLQLTNLLYSAHVFTETEMKETKNLLRAFVVG